MDHHRHSHLYLRQAKRSDTPGHLGSKLQGLGELDYRIVNAQNCTHTHIHCNQQYAMDAFSFSTTHHGGALRNFEMSAASKKAGPVTVWDV